MSKIVKRILLKIFNIIMSNEFKELTFTNLKKFYMTTNFHGAVASAEVLHNFLAITRIAKN